VTAVNDEEYRTDLEAIEQIQQKLDEMDFEEYDWDSMNWDQRRETINKVDATVEKISGVAAASTDWRMNAPDGSVEFANTKIAIKLEEAKG